MIFKVCLPFFRHEFDSEQIPDLSRDVFKQDIHSVGSLCKLYFRELPNPLLTYQLYDRFSVRTFFFKYINKKHLYLKIFSKSEHVDISRNEFN